MMIVSFRRLANEFYIKTPEESVLAGQLMAPRHGQIQAIERITHETEREWPGLFFLNVCSNSKSGAASLKGKRHKFEIRT